jgi:hypothetical protein
MQNNYANHEYAVFYYRILGHIMAHFQKEVLYVGMMFDALHRMDFQEEESVYTTIYTDTAAL